MMKSLHLSKRIITLGSLFASPQQAALYLALRQRKVRQSTIIQFSD
jgi:hypothetical protein